MTSSIKRFVVNRRGFGVFAKHLPGMILLLFLYVLPAVPAFAADESYIQTIAGKLKKGDSCMVVDDKFEHLSLADWNQINNLSVDNIISFELRRDTAIHFYNRSFTCTLNVTIKYFSSRDQQSPTEIKDVNLVVKYDTTSGSYYPVDAAYRFKNAYRVTVVVNSITSKEFGKKIPDIFRIRNQIFVKRKYPFTQDGGGKLRLQVQEAAASSSGKSASMLRVATTLDPADQKLDITWDPLDFPGAEEYDLEWAYIDRYGEYGKRIEDNYGGITGPYNIPVNLVEEWMRFNSTRVTIPAFSYTINLPYTEGYIIVRIRKISYQTPSGLRLTDDWVYEDDNNNTACIYIDHHNEELNWQYTGSFAEGGKRKEVITYFDATMRNREMVTISNTEDKAIVAETVYDIMGRAAMNILPAPIDANKLQFYSAINKNASGNAYSHDDIGLPDNTTCNIEADDMSNVSGASQYYSSNNPFIGNTSYYFTKYVPDAGGYPFSVKEYTADNTGRIRRQGGVGQTFQTGSGHETRYYYSKPMQKDLDRLFGVEVGNASHYLKNMVVDPNGQISVSYIDPDGKTIATALAGIAPGNLDQLSSATASGARTTINQSLIKAADFRVDGGALLKQSAATFTAVVTGNFTVHYSVSPAALLTTPTASPAFCSNCYYDITVDVKDDCGNPVATKTSTPFTGNDIACHENALAVTDDLSFTVPKIGEYTVTYTLKLSEEQIKYQVDQYIANNTDLKTLQAFLHDEILTTDLQACYSECSTCEVKLGTLSEFTANMNALLLNLKNEKYEGFTFDPASTIITNWINTTYTALYNNCAAIAATCQPEMSPCDIKLEQMKADVRPGGQYALFDADTYAIPASESNVSILSYNKGIALNYKSDAQITNYAFTDENGAVRHIKDGDVTVAEFFKAYMQHPEWADDFVKRHIEYCSYQWCNSYASSSYIFDAKLQEQITTGEKAQSAGYFSRTNYKALLDANKDPFFVTGGPGAAYKTSMQDDLLNASKALQIFIKDSYGTTQPVKNILQLIDWVLYCRPVNTSATQTDWVNSWNSCSPSSSCRSLTREWELYRSYYLQLKAKYVQLAKEAALPNCKNCFVGESLLASASCSSECPTISEFKIDTVYIHNNGVGDYSFAGYVYHKTGVNETPVNRPVKVKIRVYSKLHRFTSSWNNACYISDNSYWIEFQPGESRKKIDNFFMLPSVDYCSELGANSTHTLFAMQILTDAPQCSPLPSSPSCTSDPLYAAYHYKRKVFNEYSGEALALNCLAVNGSPYASEAQSVDALRSQAILDLVSLKESWEYKLKSVRDEENALDVANGVTQRFAGISNTNITTLINHLYEIAKKHIETADVYHIRPASSLPTGITSAHGHNNFTEAFTAVIGSTLMAKGFGPDLLEQPYPYDRTPFMVNVAAGDINSTICASVAALRPSGYTDQQFHTWLQQELKDDYKLSLSELQDLLNRCTNNCRFLDKTVLLPVAFMTTAGGDAPHSYEGCSVISTLLADFGTVYPNVAIDTKLYRVLLTNYLNKNLGYALSYDEYAGFTTDCMTNTNARLYNKPASPLLQPDDFACTADIVSSAFDRAGQNYYVYIEEIKRNFRNAYISKCLSNEATANLEGDQYEYHYTLYYYDQAGNLVKTIAPEGVDLLQGNDLDNIDIYRNMGSVCDGTGLPQTEDQQAAFTDVSSSLQNNTAKSLELWLYSNGGSTRQFRIVTPDHKYICQAALQNGKLWIELYTLNKINNQQIAITATNHVVTDVSTITLKDWSHLVIQSSTGIASGALSVYFDGQLLTSLAPAAYPLSWGIDYSGSNYVMPAIDAAIFKHLRVYNRIITTQEIAANMQSACFMPEGNLAVTSNPLLLWYRFNIPSGGVAESNPEGQPPFLVPQHRMAVNYYYNSLNQVVKQSSPDGGTSEFWYDRLGRLAISQNEEQQSPAMVDPENPAGRFSYTMYDDLGRIKEVGEKLNAGSVTENNARNTSWLGTWLASGSNRQVTLTYYDNEPTGWLPSSLTGTLSNLRKRVAATVLLSAGSDPAYNRQAATYYSYDISGNVKTLTQENTALKTREAAYVTGSTGLKQIKYEYDLVSGKVNKVLYQDGKWDQFYYWYLYDADNRVTDALSSRTNESDPNLWVKEASYRYYLHGPLARVELGKNKVQGMDFAYTLQGWLKGVNGQLLDPDRDMSKDGKAGEPFASQGRDVLAFSLGYYADDDPADGKEEYDYVPVGGMTNAPAFKIPFSAPAYDKSGVVRDTYHGKNLFNGNISSSTYAISNIESGAARGKTYRYDQLNRLTGAVFKTNVLTTSSPTWGSGTSYWSYHMERFQYDANGNINLKWCLPYPLSMAAQRMDQLSYKYNVDGNNKLINNRLNYVTDQAAAGNFPDDIDSQSPDNYTYDKIGNLIGDVSETITRINWTVYGKIASITKGGNPMSYGYDAGGNRITKTISATKEDYYVRDAQGNVLTLYGYDNSSFTWAEQHLYGSSRVGMVTPGLTIQSSTPLANASYNATGDPVTNGTEGKRVYELTNHLGNVMVTISDRKIGVDENSDAVIDYYTAEVLTAQDYYAGGMLMPGRTYQAGAAFYRYSINGQEKTPEIAPNTTTAEFWQYDARIMRRWNVDPRPTVGVSQYSVFNNNPIFHSDPFGDTTLPTPGRNTTMVGLPDNATFETYKAGTAYQVGGKNVSVQAGQLRSFTVNGKTYNATWSSNTLEFSGYKDDKGKSGTHLFKSITQNDGLSDFERTLDYFKFFNPISEEEVYTSVQFKTTVQKPGNIEKMVIPYGIQGSYNTEKGGDVRQITPLDAYINFGIKNYYTDFRYMPGQTNFVTGDLASGRALFTVPFLSRGVYKTQLDIADKNFTKLNLNNLTVGSRGVIESPVNLRLPFTNTSYSVEMNFGLRFHFDRTAFLRRGAE